MLPEIVADGEDGLVVPHDGAALAAAIVRLAKEPEFRDRLAKNARRKARERFDLERQAAAVDEVYRRLVSGGRGNGNGRGGSRR
jgi:mannosyltransferase